MSPSRARPSRSRPLSTMSEIAGRPSMRSAHGRRRTARSAPVIVEFAREAEPFVLQGTGGTARPKARTARPIGRRPPMAEQIRRGRDQPVVGANQARPHANATARKRCARPKDPSDAPCPGIDGRVSLSRDRIVSRAMMEGWLFVGLSGRTLGVESLKQAKIGSPDCMTI